MFLIRLNASVIIIIIEKQTEDKIDIEWIHLFRRYKTDSHEHEQKGMFVNNELTVVGAYSVDLPGGYKQTTMYVADKNGYRPQVQLRFSNLLKSAIGWMSVYRKPCGGNQKYIFYTYTYVLQSYVYIWNYLRMK